MIDKFWFKKCFDFSLSFLSTITDLCLLFFIILYNLLRKQSGKWKKMMKNEWVRMNEWVEFVSGYLLVPSSSSSTTEGMWIFFFFSYFDIFLKVHKNFIKTILIIFDAPSRKRNNTATTHKWKNMKRKRLSEWKRHK